MEEIKMIKKETKQAVIKQYARKEGFIILPPPQKSRHHSQDLRRR